MNGNTYRWIEPETVTFDKQGNKVILPERQEEGKYLEDASIPGYVVVLWNGKKHLVANYNVVMIY